MKRTIIAATMLIISAVAMHAQENTASNDSVTVITNPDTVKITNGKEHISIEVIKQGEDYKLERDLSGNDITVINQKLDFDIPFIGKNKEKWEQTKRRQRNAKFDLFVLRHLEYGMGLVTATNQAEGMDVKMANCGWEFTLNNLFGLRYAPTKNTQLQMGFGVNWRNYRMKNDNRFFKQDDNHLIIAPYPNGANIEFSRIKIFSMTLEMLVAQYFTKNIKVTAGPVVNFNSHGSIKTRYKLNGEGHKETSSNINQNAVTIDFKAEVGVDPVSLYFKYSPQNMLDTNYGPEFHSMSAGIKLTFGEF